MSDRMPDSRRSSRGRHRAQVAPASDPLLHRLRPGRTAQGVLVLGLVLSLGGYTVAESTTQRRAAAVNQSAAAAAVQTRAEIAGERARAVATAQSAVADATAVTTVAAGSVSDSDLADLTQAVEHLTSLIADVPAEAEAATTAHARAGRASRGVTREAVPTAGTDPAATGPAATGPAATDPAATDPAADQAGATSGAPTPGADATAEPPISPEELSAALAASDAAQAAARGPVATRDAPSTATENPLRAPVDDATPDDRMAAGIMASAARVANLTARVKTVAEQVVADAADAAASVAQAEQAAAASAKEAAQRASLAAYANGRVPADALCDLSFAAGQQLRCDAADALALLNASYRATFGADLVVTDSYRSYSAQVACSRTKGRLCATPGTSNHGRGVAVDLGDGIQVFGTQQHRWMASHAAEFGWALPAWASLSGSKREPWHWEFTG